MKIFENFSFRKLLYNKKFSIALSILVAFVFWLVIVIDQNPEREQTLTNLPIDVTTDGTIWGEQGLKVVNEVTQKASVTVYGPNYIVSSLKSEDIKVTADLTAVNGAGNYNVTISAVRNSDVSGYSVLNISPSTVSVRLDYFDEKEFTIIPKVEGYGKVEGLTYDDAVVANSEQSFLTVSGPRTDVSKVATVVAYASTDKTLSTTTTFDGVIELYDENGRLIENTNLSYNTDSVKISLPVSKTKVLSFSPTYLNLPNEKVAAELNSCLTTDIKNFTVAGPPEVIDSLDKIEFTPIDVTAISSKNKNSFELVPVLPNGVRITDGIDSVSVSFDLSGYTVKRIKITNFKDDGTLGGGLKASFNGEVYVEVCGKKNVINSLSSDDFYLTADLSDLSKGESLVKASVKTYDDYAVWPVVTCEIKVEIK